MNLLLRPRFPLAQGQQPVVDIWRQQRPTRLDPDDDLIPILVAIHERRRQP